MWGRIDLKLIWATALIALMALVVAAPAGASLSGEGEPLSPETGNIRGTVTDEDGVPVEHLLVCAMTLAESPGFEYCARTEEGGQYLIYNARIADDYKVFGEAPWYLGEEPAGRENHPQVWYPGVEHPDDATTISVKPESTTSGVDFQVHEGGEITGTVTDEATGAPVAGIQVCPVWVGTPQRGEERPCGFSDSEGHYSIKSIDTDEYTLRLDAQYAPGYQSGTYSAPGSVGPTVVSVVAGTVTSGIDPQVSSGGGTGEAAAASGGSSAQSPGAGDAPSATGAFAPVFPLPAAHPRLACHRGLHKSVRGSRVRCVGSVDFARRQGKGGQAAHRRH